MEENNQDSKNQKLHFIIIPPPFLGHINPSVQLSLNLASKGFIVTFVNTQATHHQIAKSLHSKEIEGHDPFAESGLDIRYRTISDGFPLSFDRSLNRDQFLEGRLHVFPALVDELVGQLMAGSDPRPTCLIADTFSSWGSIVAQKHGLVYISFWTQPALAFTLYYHLDLLKKNGHYASIENRKDIIDYVPGVRQIEYKDLMTFLHETDTSKIMSRVIDKVFADVKKADFIICNTVQELESIPIAYLNEKQPFYAIGPLFPAQFTDRAVEMNLWSEFDCFRWLDRKPKGSVLYVSLGSYAHSSKEEISEMANGLMLSGVDFIWVLRPDTVVSSVVTDFLPTGFQEEVGDRGLVVPWCKQNAVISHSAIGGFLTHCGWNSILESIWCGVPMICFPLIGDQTTNRKLVVDDWKVGIGLCEGGFVSSKEVEEKIKILMNRGTSRNLRESVENFRKILKKAVSSDGSSRMHFDKFVEEVKAKIMALKKGSNGISD